MSATHHSLAARQRLLNRLQHRLDTEALAQLRAEAARLAAENDDMRERLICMEENAEFWSREATGMHLQLCELRGGAPGITQGGALVVVQGAMQ